MRFFCFSLFFSAVLLNSSAEACEIRTYISKLSNPVPAAWMRTSMQENNLCGTLISTPTSSSGRHDRLHKRGRRDTIVIIPDGLEVSTHTDIIYWFHGLTGFKEKTFRKRLGPQYSWLVNNQQWPAILVVAEMPWSWFTRTRWKRQGRVFTKKNEFYNYTREVESIIMKHLGEGRDFRFDRIIIGHSAGGSAIASAAKYGGLCRTNPIGVVFSDSTYGTWFRKSWSGCLKDYSGKKKVRIMVLGQSFGRPWKRYSDWARRNKRRSKTIEAYRLPTPWTHGRIGNNAIPFFYHRFLDRKYKNIYN